MMIPINEDCLGHDCRPGLWVEQHNSATSLEASGVPFTTSNLWMIETRVICGGVLCLLLLFGGHVASNHSSHARWNRFIAKWKKLLRNCMRVCEWERTKARLLFLSFIIFFFYCNVIVIIVLLLPKYLVGGVYSQYGVPNPPTCNRLCGLNVGAQK